jgi:hypothetical protein
VNLDEKTGLCAFVISIQAYKFVVDAVKWVSILVLSAQVDFWRNRGYKVSLPKANCLS